MARRITAQQVLERILDLQSEESGDESGRDSDNEEAQIDEHESSDSSEEEEPAADGGQDVFRGRDGTEWQLAPEVERRGRVVQRNVFTERVGPTRAAETIRTPRDAFLELFDNWCLRHIVNCTLDHARRTDEQFQFDEQDLEKFIGLLFLRAVNHQKGFPFDQLWSKKYGSPIFSKTMPRDRARDIKKFLRFDFRDERRRNLQRDKFTMISAILNRFNENSQRLYRPVAEMTIDEQLFPTKARCRFTQYIPSKPDKFGIKFWILAEVNSKFCYNIKPYLGRDEERTQALGSHVVMKLTEPIWNKGYNITTDNFFTSADLARQLLAKRTTIVGTVRAHRRELPPPPPQRLELHSSIFYESNELHLTRYQAKRTKTVHILSTQHRGTTCQPDGKKKPFTILYYNSTKYGVDMLDQMARQLSTKSGCRRWPLAVFFNIIDLAAINAWILYKKVTHSNVSRRKFLHDLSSELRHDAPPPVVNDDAPPVVLNHRVTCSVKLNCQKNRTVNICRNCDRPVCGKCQAIVCANCF